MERIYNAGLTLGSACYSNDDRVILPESAFSYLGFGPIGNSELNLNLLSFAVSKEINRNQPSASASATTNPTRRPARFPGTDGWRCPALFLTQQFLEEQHQSLVKNQKITK